MAGTTRAQGVQGWLIAAGVGLLVLLVAGSAAVRWFSGPHPQAASAGAPGAADDPAAGGTADPNVMTLPSDVLFDLDSAALRDDAEAALEAVAARITAPGFRGTVTVTGYTDDLGSDGYNDHLSELRAKTVADWLAERTRLPWTRFVVRHYGALNPAEPNDTDAHRRANRRVVVTLGT